MIQRICVFIAVFIFCAIPSVAQGILPDSFARWNGSASAQISSGQAAAANKGTGATEQDAAETLTEYGFAAAEQRAYTGSGETLQVTVYRMKDPSGAYGEYSYLRTPDMLRAGFTDHSSMARDHSLILTGNLVLDIRGSNLPQYAKDLKALTDAVGQHADHGPYPSIWQRLPVRNIVQRSDHYILGPQTLHQFFPLSPAASPEDWLGFSEGAEAEVARYRINGSDALLLVADFPTPQTAQKKLIELQQKFSVNGSSSSGNHAPLLFAKRSLTLLSIVSGARTQAEADTLLDQVQSGAIITWDEPTFEFTQPGIVTYIVGAFIGTGLICAFAVVAGLAFGGFRLIMKRAFPNKVFDRSEQIEVLQLGLLSKPIKAEDFYSIGKRPPQ